MSIVPIRLFAYVARRGALMAAISLGTTVTFDGARADMSETVSRLLKVCLATGSASELEGSGNGEVSLTLRALRTGNIGAGGSLGGRYIKKDWEGLQGGLSAGMSQLQADQADKVRACLAPYMPGIVQAILQSN
jgi:hypothetical protein